MTSKLNPCPICNREVEIKYCAGMSESLRETVPGLPPLVDSVPIWYIRCECGLNVGIKVDKQTAEVRDKRKRQLVRKWNKFTEEYRREFGSAR